MKRMIRVVALMTVVPCVASAQVIERAVARPGIAVQIAPAPGTASLLPVLGAPANLSITGTPSTASLKWDGVANATGYVVTRVDPTGVATKLTPVPITTTRFDDLSGGVRPSATYTYRVSATATNYNDGSTQQTFTAPAAAVPAWARVDQSSDGGTLTWAAVSGAASYKIVESWCVLVQIPVYSGTTQTGYTTRTDCQSRVHVIPAPQTSLRLFGDALKHRFSVGAVYEPGSVTAPASQWPSVGPL